MATSGAHIEAALRRTMVGQLETWGADTGIALDPAVLDAMLLVSRAHFTRGAAPEDAYDAHAAIVTKRDPAGLAISSVSAPTIVAMMVTQLAVRPGHRVLEIGSGGYNAALLRELVGPSGQVTTLDVDPDVATGALERLRSAGYEDVEVRFADGEFGAPDRALFDRIVVTVEAADVPPAWVGQLRPGGRLVVPLRMCGLTRSVAFTDVEGVLVSSGYELCGFVPMQGAGEHREQRVPLAEGVELRLDDGQRADGEALRSALAGSRAEVGTGLRVANQEPFTEHLDLWLATMLPGFGLLTAGAAAVDRGLVNPAWPGGRTPAITRGGTLAYRSWRRFDGGAEVRVTAHGPDAADVAAEFAQAHRVWAGTRRPGSPARIAVYPAGTPDAELPAGYRLDRRHSRTVITWS
ncbi:methyltransferase, FxLD system [Cryptosporangium phraense]|uniref:Protein-L-isoaspartate O-methyltransferase n=1 Tax=Cryptosporangium phraense TaxID=2593070 RepID=A0A545AL65_9ACTN|nr:methyltransferase, FxLD system [Cryptosporangium phraense]TQS42056.1 methyltransferase, FxLD system [Cryptosporangium phraense]